MKNNQNTHRDLNTPDEYPAQDGVEIAQPAELMKTLAALDDAVMRDQPVTQKMIDDFRGAMNGLTVRIDGRDMSMQKLERHPNVKIWRQILAGDYSRTNRLTALTTRIATELAHSLTVELPLNGLKSVTTEHLKILATYPFDLELNGLKNLTDEQAQILSKFHGVGLMLNGLTHLSDAQMKALAKCDMEFIEFNGLERITETQAEILSGYNARQISLSGLASLSDASADHLAPILSKIVCMPAINLQISEAVFRSKRQ